MLKTLEQLLTTGTMLEIAATIKNNTDRLGLLFDAATDRADKANTQAELDEIKQIDSDTEQLNTRYAELKKVEEARQRNEERVKGFMAPVNRPPFPNGTPEPKKSRSLAHSVLGDLKHINLYGNRQQDQELAFKF